MLFDWWGKSEGMWIVSFFVYDDKIDILNETIVSYPVIRHIAMNMVDKYVVSDFAIMNRCMANTRFELHSSIEDKYFIENSHFDGSRKIHGTPYSPIVFK